MTESDEVVAKRSEKTKLFCDFCNISFSARKNLYPHLRKFHQVQVVVKGNQACGICDEKFYTMAQLYDHIQNQHSITLKFINETFYSEKDFQDWKNEIEKESLSFYVHRNSSRKKHRGITNDYYTCNRSGPFKMKQNRIRSVKASGSIKTGNTCPAFIKVSTQTVDGISEIKVQFQSVHLGHDAETRVISFKKQEREKLAACLKLGISMDKILDETRQNISPTNRYRHLTRKHLHNIHRDFGIPKSKENLQKTHILQNACVEDRDSSAGYEDYVDIELSNHKEIEEHETSAVVSSLLLLQNQDYSEKFNNRKLQVIDQLKEVLSRIEKWDPLCSLPNVEVHIKALNACLDNPVPLDSEVYV